jgi:uncharacterized membrane protein YadS
VLGYLFALYVFRMHTNKGLALIVVGATLICGESAAVAISSTIKGNAQDLTLVTSMIALISIFQIIFIPIFCRLVQMNEFIAGGWIGGSVDTTGGLDLSFNYSQELSLLVNLWEEILI